MGGPKELKELNHLRGLIKFRINKQEQLLDKIVNGKWKSSHVSDQVLYALTKHDLSLLRAMKSDVDSQLNKLSNQVDKDNE